MSFKGLKVLLIEDNEMNRNLCCDILKIFNAQVVEAENAENGLALLEEDLPDLILMDVQLPGMDGIQATRLIKRNPEWNRIPVIAITAHALEGELDEIMEAGFDSQICKPFKISDFVAEVSRHLGVEAEFPQS
ncbi:MAG: response regulator [Deltaproteobacteria bacterium]|nr:response regulator [Deltaproteobacteria bacterium]